MQLDVVSGAFPYLVPKPKTEVKVRHQPVPVERRNSNHGMHLPAAHRALLP
jgi:hypothetical protein